MRRPATRACSPRACAQSRARSQAARAIPTPCAAALSRDFTTERIESSHPSRSAPRRFAAGMRQSSKNSSAVEEPRIPSLPSAFPDAKPGVPRSTRKAVMPSRPASRSTVANTTTTSARSPVVMNDLAPSST